MARDRFVGWKWELGWRPAVCLAKGLSLQESQRDRDGGRLAMDTLRDEVGSLQRVLASITEVRPS